jgi:ribosomal protein S18 acetylase RimI-like enzyme
MSSGHIPEGPPHVLDNPVWHSLAGRHQHLAMGGRWARRYPPAVSVFAAIADRDDRAIEELHRIVAPGEVIALGGLEVAELPGWSQVGEIQAVQMVCDQPVAAAHFPHEVVALTGVDRQDMERLIALTDPGPFGPRTAELGRFTGIRQHGKLVAMIGERFHPPGHHEMSLLCVDPVHQGQGYGTALFTRLCAQQAEEGDVPFLHVAVRNVRAIALYERLHFRVRREVRALVLRR